MVKVNQNDVQLIGKLVSLRKVWSSNEHTTYEGVLQIIRDSGNIDMIPILFNDITPPINEFMTIIGQFRSRDTEVQGKLKVELYVCAKDIKIIQNSRYDNVVYMDGFVCKKPTIRTTPSGK